MSTHDSSYVLLTVRGVVHATPFSGFPSIPLDLSYAWAFCCNSRAELAELQEHVNVKTLITCIGCTVNMHTIYAHCRVWGPSGV